MSDLKEAAMRKALAFAEQECGGRCNAEYNPCCAYEVADTLRSALAQQPLELRSAAEAKADREHAEKYLRQAEFYLTSNEETLHAEIDRLKAALAQQGEQPVCAGCGIPAGDVHMSTCQSGKWPSRVSNGDTAAPAPQAQDWKKEPEYVPPLVK